MIASTMSITLNVQIIITPMAVREEKKHRKLSFILPHLSPSEPATDKRSHRSSLTSRPSSSLLNNQSNLNSSRLSSPIPVPTLVRAGSGSESVINFNGINDDNNDDDGDLNDSSSAKENYRFAPQFIRNRRYSSNFSTANQRRINVFPKTHNVVVSVIPTRSTEPTATTNTSYQNLRGQTLMHLAARLGHDEILRLLFCETSQASMLMDKQGQTPLLIAIKTGCTNTATLLMESDPRSIIVSDDHGSNVFHYACEYCNDVILNRAITLLKRLNSSSDRIKVNFIRLKFDKYFFFWKYILLLF